MLTGGIFILANKYRLGILAVVGLAVLAIFILSTSTFFRSDGDETIYEEVTVGDAETTAINLTEFKPAEYPFTEFTQARDNKKPIVLEFYARW